MRFNRVRIPRRTASGTTTMIQRYLWGAESRRAERAEKERAYRVRSSRITRCRRWYNARISCERSFLSREISHRRRGGEDRGSRGFDATSRPVLRGWKRERPRESEKFPRRRLALFSFRRCLSACSNKSLRVTVQRPQVSADTTSPVECLSYVEPLQRGTPITSD